MGLGVGDIFSVSKQAQPGPPFVPTSANNGLSVNGVSGKIVLGDDIGGILSTLISNREIPLSTYFIKFKLGSVAKVQINPDGSGSIVDFFLANPATLIGLNINHSVGGAGTGTTFNAIKSQNNSSTGNAANQVLNNLGNGVTISSKGSGTSTGDIGDITSTNQIFTITLSTGGQIMFTPLEIRMTSVVAGFFYRWYTNSIQRMVLLNNGNFRISTVNTDNGSTLQVDGTITGDGFILPRNITPYTINAQQDRGDYFTNEGAGALQVFNLPAATRGNHYHFIVQNVNGIRIQASGANTIRIAATVSAAGATSVVVGSALDLIAINSNEWIAVSQIGTWTIP